MCIIKSVREKRGYKPAMWGDDGGQAGRGMSPVWNPKECREFVSNDKLIQTHRH